MLPIVGGSCPVMLLCARDRVLRFARFVICVGIVPVKLLLSAYSTSENGMLASL